MKVRFSKTTSPSVGIALRPKILEESDETLKSGMAITVEPFTYVEGVGATRHCDMVLVTDDGRERLSKSPAGWLEISK